MKWWIGSYIFECSWRIQAWKTIWIISNIGNFCRNFWFCFGVVDELKVAESIRILNKWSNRFFLTISVNCILFNLHNQWRTRPLLCNLQKIIILYFDFVCSIPYFTMRFSLLSKLDLLIGTKLSLRIQTISCFMS